MNKYTIGWVNQNKEVVEYFNFPNNFITDKEKAFTFMHFPRLHAEDIQKNNPGKEIVIIGDDV